MTRPTADQKRRLRELAIELRELRKTRSHALAEYLERRRELVLGRRKTGLTLSALEAKLKETRASG